MQSFGYIVEVILCSGLFVAFYKWLLVGKISFRVCRWYILITMLLGAVIPLLNIPVYETDEIFVKFLLLEDNAAGMGGVNNYVLDGGVAGNSAKDIVHAVLFMIYLGVAVLSLVLILRNVKYILTLRRNSKLTHTENYTLAENRDIKTPFSFIRTIFMGCNYEKGEREIILLHEQSHISHGHSYEKIFLSVLRSVFWFNPFYWIAENSLEEVQEWEADRDVLRRENNLKLYRTTIFKQLFGYNPDISCGLNHSLTKQRFKMMTQTQRGKGAWLRLAATLPLFAITILAFGSGYAETSSENVPVLENGVKEIVINVTANGTKYLIDIDGVQCSMNDVAKVISQRISAEESKPVVRINTSGDVKVGVVTDIKQQLRNAGALRVQYTVNDSQNATPGILPPANASYSNNKTFEVHVTPVIKEGVICVKINHNDKILFGSANVSLNEVTQLVAQTIRERGISKDNSAPKCIFVLETDRGTSAEVYTKIQKNIREAYDIVRNEYSVSTFNKDFNSLTAEQANKVKMTIPIQVAEAELKYE